MYPPESRHSAYDRECPLWVVSGHSPYPDSLGRVGSGHHLLKQADDGNHSAHCVGHEVFERIEHALASFFRRFGRVAERCGHATASFAAVFEHGIDAGGEPAVVMKRREYGPVER